MSGYIVSPKADEDIFEVCLYLFERAVLKWPIASNPSFTTRSRRSLEIRARA